MCMVVHDVCSESISQLMNATTASAAAVEDRDAQTSYTDSLLTTMKQVHNQIEQLEVSSVSGNAIDRQTDRHTHSQTDRQTS